MTRLVRVSENLIDDLLLRTVDGRLLLADWGEPDAGGFYEPVFRAVDDGMTVVGREEIEWLRDVVENITPSEYRAVIKRIDKRKDWKRGMA